MRNSLLLSDNSCIKLGSIHVHPGISSRGVLFYKGNLNMINVTNVSLSYGKKVLFKDVNIKFLPGNCYGLIGANGAGKSTFLKIISGEVEQDKGEVTFGPDERISVLSQDQFAFDNETVINTVMMGHKRLFTLMAEREKLYAKPELTDEEGILCGEIECEFGEMNGYEAEAEAAVLLKGLGVPESFLQKKMKDLLAGDKVRVLLAQALFGNPDVLLLDEPTNNLDLKCIAWLEEFLCEFQNTVIVISHDRHFLNQVCTHTADIDFGAIRVYAGNYDFWCESSQLLLKQKQNENKKNQKKADELKEFIRRFSANASKSKQATARKKVLDSLSIEHMPISSRKYPYIKFQPERPCGNIILEIKGLSKDVDGVRVLNNIDLTVHNGDKIAFVGSDNHAKTTLFSILAGEMEPDSGSVDWGVTITPAYMPIENSAFFDNDMNLVDWICQFNACDDESFARGFLGRMLFKGDEVLKKTNVLSGGEKVRCMLSRLMLSGANVLIMDEPTNHLDLESLTSLNNGLEAFTEVLLFSSRDRQLVSTVANRIVEITPEGIVDNPTGYDEYLENEESLKEWIKLAAA